jgi:hypothetical protein
MKKVVNGDVVSYYHVGVAKGDKRALLKALKALSTSRDPEEAHASAEHAVLEFIGDDSITKAYNDVPKWYA